MFNVQRFLMTHYLGCCGAWGLCFHSSVRSYHRTQQTSAEGWGDVSVGNVFAMKVWGISSIHAKMSMVALVCNLRARGLHTNAGRSWGSLASQPVRKSELHALWEIMFQKIKGRSDWERHSDIGLCPPHIPTQVCASCHTTHTILNIHILTWGSGNCWLNEWVQYFVFSLGWAPYTLLWKVNSKYRSE